METVINDFGGWLKAFYVFLFVLIGVFILNIALEAWNLFFAFTTSLAIADLVKLKIANIIVVGIHLCLNGYAVGIYKDQQPTTPTTLSIIGLANFLVSFLVFVTMLVVFKPQVSLAGAFTRQAIQLVFPLVWMLYFYQSHRVRYYYGANAFNRSRPVDLS